MHSWNADSSSLLIRDYYTDPSRWSWSKGDVHDIKVVLRTKRDAAETPQVVEPNFDEPPKLQISAVMLYVHALSLCFWIRMLCVPEALA